LSFYEGNYSKIDLVMLDMFMPEIDGADLYEKMRKINRQMKSILLTGYNITEELKNKITTDKNGLIQKPVSIKKLSQTISEILYK
jgi:YesN/AraC family two-component response regulator